MIDPTNRISRLLQEARDPEVGVIVMDFVLGFGAHEDPVGVMIDAIKEAQAIAKADNRPLEILGYVLGTDQDPQSLAQQCQLLTDGRHLGQQQHQYRITGTRICLQRGEA
jgi:hypothetical protein